MTPIVEEPCADDSAEADDKRRRPKARAGRATTKPIAANLISSTPSIAGMVGRERSKVRGVAGAGASGGGRDVADGV